MNVDDIKIVTGENSSQTACFENHDKTIEYEISKNPAFSDIIAISKGLDVISEFYDVNAVAATTPMGICAVCLGKTLEEAVNSVLDSNPIEFMSSVITASKEVDSDIVKLFKNTNIVVAPSFTKNAIEYLEAHDICYVIIKTPLKDYKKYLSNKVIHTPLGTLTESPNLSELDKESFKVISKSKPTVEQIEDAVFAWKVAKHAPSRAIVVAKDFKTVSISQGLHSATVEYALDYACEKSKDAVLASDLPLTLHDINVAAQGRIANIIAPCADKNVLSAIDKYNMIFISTGITNALY